MRTLFVVACVLVVITVVACADKTPVKFRYDLPAAVTNPSYFSFQASAVNKKDQVISGKTVAVSGGLAEILEVTPSGQLRCAKTGDATLTLTAGSYSENVPVKCRIPTEIDMPAEIQVVVGKPPVAVHPPILGEAGKALTDVSVNLSSSDPAVLAVEGDKVKGLKVGKAHLTGSLGGISAITTVEVVETVVDEALTLKDGANRTVSLQPDNYRVIVNVKEDPRLKQGVTIAWSGTPCEGKPESATQLENCRVLEPSTVSVANPKLFGIGATITGHFQIFRIP